jgi:macrolide-specific efflux system membrane fusion protein
MPVYFKTLGGGERRWYGTVQQILPTPEVLNNVVLYTGLFEVENTDGTLLSEMTAQVYFVTSSAENVLTIPLGALSFAGEEQNSARYAATGANGGGGPPSGFTPPEGFTPPAGAGAFAGGGARGPRGVQAAAGPRPALVTVVNADGTREERQVMVGLTSRVAAEIVSGLREGEQVIAGVVQPDAPVQEQQQQNRGPAIRLGGGGRGF